MIILSLGTNIGNRRTNLETALKLIESFAHITRRSSIIETEPVGFESMNKFLNMCVSVETLLTPVELLDATQQVERQMGRTIKSLNGIYHDRIIDIDIIDYNNQIINTPRLTLPHPRAAERPFVQIPLSEL